MQTTLVSMLALAAGTTATNWPLGIPYKCPANQNNVCTPEQAAGFDWQGLKPGAQVDTYNGFNFKGGHLGPWKCHDSNLLRLGKRTGHLGLKGGVSVGCHHDVDTSPSFGCGASAEPFSIKGMHVSTENDDDDVDFHYQMPDASICKSRHKCSRSGTHIVNSQCGGATSVTVVYPTQTAAHAKETCSLTMHSLSFDCAGPSATVPVAVAVPTLPVVSIPSDSSVQIVSPTLSASVDVPVPTISAAVPVLPVATGSISVSVPVMDTTMNMPVPTGSLSMPVPVLPVESISVSLPVASVSVPMVSVSVPMVSVSVPMVSVSVPMVPMPSASMSVSVPVLAVPSFMSSPVIVPVATTFSISISAPIPSMPSVESTLSPSINVPVLSMPSIEMPSLSVPTESATLDSPVPGPSSPAIDFPEHPLITGVTTIFTTNFLSTSTVMETSYVTVTSCAPDITNCPADKEPVIVTNVVAVSTTICPVTATQTAIVNEATTHIIGVTPFGDVLHTSVTHIVSGTTVAITSLTNDSPVAAPTPVADVPALLPNCMATFNFQVGCKDNFDLKCLCSSPDFAKNMFDCAYAHGESDDQIAHAVSFFQGLCAPHAVVNPAIATAATVTSFLTAMPTLPVAAVTTVHVQATGLVPFTDANGMSSYSKVFINTFMTAPQVGFATTAGAVNVVPITGFAPPIAVLQTPTGAGFVPGAQPTYAGMTGVAAAAPSGTGAARPGSGPVTAGATGVRASLGLGVAVVAMLAML